MSVWVRSAEQLEQLAGRLRGCTAIGLDTEADSLHHFAEKVCLVQIAADRGGAWLVDPLVLRDLSPLGAVLGDPGIVKVLHGADYDVSMVKRDFGLEIASLFDTMLAARLLGMPGVGLQAVVEAELGVRLSKGNQKDDWSRRPLTASQEAYALADVEHLVALRERLEARLAGVGRLEWLREECEAVAALPPARAERDPEAYRRLKGASRLPRRGLAVLRELVLWRDRRAAERDVPPFRIVGNDVLLALATQPPRDLAALRGLAAFGPRLQRHATEVLGAVDRGLRLPERDCPALERRSRRSVPEPSRRRVSALRQWRAEEARRLALDISVILPQRLIDRVAEAAPRDAAALGEVEGLRRWRVEAFGPAILAAIRAA